MSSVLKGRKEGGGGGGSERGRLVRCSGEVYLKVLRKANHTAVNLPSSWRLRDIEKSHTHTHTHTQTHTHTVLSPHPLSYYTCHSLLYSQCTTIGQVL